MSSRKNPPNFDPEVDDYTSWKSDVAIWKLYTDTADVKVGPAVYLSLQGKARDVVRGMTPQIVGAATVYDSIIAELDKVYLSNESSRAFVAIQELYGYRRECHWRIVKWCTGVLSAYECKPI